MKNNGKNILAVANIFCAVTEAAYYVTKVDCTFFNIAAIIWLLTMLANMVVCLNCRKNAVLRTIAMMSPSLLMMLNAMLGTNATTPTMGIIVEVLAFIYFVFSAFHAWYLSSERFERKEEKSASILSLVLYGLFYLLAMSLFLLYYYFILIASELTMSSIIALLSGFITFLPIWAFSASLGLYRRLRTRGVKMIPKVVMCVAVITFTCSFIPVLASPNTAHNADMQYVRVFGGANESFSYSLPEAMFGSTESGYTVVENQVYHTMVFENRNYDLAYDMYKPADETEATPIIIRMHGSGSSKGLRNNALMDAALASEGYTVFDINYGNEKVKPSNDDLAENVCVFLNYLYENQEELNIDTDNIFLSGASRGGKMALKACVAWSSNSHYNLKNKVTIRGAVLYWAFMNDVFTREGDERIVSLEELNSDLPAILFIDTTHDGSVQGGNMMEGVLYTLGVPSANIELRYTMHGASNNYYSVWGQLCDYYFLRFADDLVQ